MRIMFIAPSDLGRGCGHEDLGQPFKTYFSPLRRGSFVQDSHRQQKVRAGGVFITRVFFAPERDSFREPQTS